MKRGLSLVLVAIVLIWISRSAIWAQSDGKFEELTELMDRQEHLWFALPPKRLRETDVSASFCGKFTPEDLHQIAAEHPTITKFLADVKFQNLPPATDAWWFTRPTWKAGRGAQSLGIYLAPGGFCYANYRHIQS